MLIASCCRLCSNYGDLKQCLIRTWMRAQRYQDRSETNVERIVNKWARTDAGSNGMISPCQAMHALYVSVGGSNRKVGRLGGRGRLTHQHQPQLYTISEKPSSSTSRIATLGSTQQWWLAFDRLVDCEHPALLDPSTAASGPVFPP